LSTADPNNNSQYDCHKTRFLGSKYTQDAFTAGDHPWAPIPFNWLLGSGGERGKKRKGEEKGGKAKKTEKEKETRDSGGERGRSGYRD